MFPMLRLGPKNTDWRAKEQEVRRAQASTFQGQQNPEVRASHMRSCITCSRPLPAGPSSSPPESVST